MLRFSSFAVALAALLTACSSHPTTQSTAQSTTMEPADHTPTGARRVASDDDGDCKNAQGGTVGKLIAQCSNVVRGSSADSLFRIDTAKFCISQLDENLNSGPAVVYYVGQQWTGAYVGSSTSKDHLLPSAAGDVAFNPNAPAQYGSFGEYYSHTDGSPLMTYGPFASNKDGKIQADSTAKDGQGQYYFNYKTSVAYDNAARTMTVQYWRENSAGLFGVGAKWVKLYDVTTSCQ